MRLGIMGGTFDPVHIGHLLLARAMLERLPLSRVLFIPAADPPHKVSDPPLAAAGDRLAMVDRAIAPFPQFETSNIELDRPGKSYTIDTLIDLRGQYPDDEMFLIIGADNVSQLSSWHEPHAILEQCTVVAGSRVTDDIDADPNLVGQLQLVETPIVEISSTMIRQRLRDGHPIRYMVPETVESYIVENGLYGNGLPTSTT